uniref:Uncharacterized protein n=1 Tax=Romanomermis culicivorax TaxID=13658 RepID=A0A915IAW3_ROMCU
MNPIDEDISFDEEGHIDMVYEHINSDERHSMVNENIRSNESDYSDIENETNNYEEPENEEIQEGAGEEEDHDPDQFFELSEPNVVNVRRFNTEGRNYSLQFRNLDQLNNLNNQMVPIFQRIIDRVSNGVDENALMGFSFGHPDLKSGQILIPFRPKHALTGDLVLNTINAVLQSNEQIQIDNREASIRLVTVTLPQGSGLHNAHQYMMHNDFLEKKQCIIQINNTDDLCFARALAVARAYVHKDDSNPLHKWENIRKSNKRNVLQTKVAKELMTEAGLANHQGPCGFKEWPKFQAIMSGYQIKVFSKERYKDLLYKGKFFTFCIIVLLQPIS